MSDSLWRHGLQPNRLLCPWGFCRHEYGSGLPCSPPGDLPNPGIKVGSPALQVDSLPAELPENSKSTILQHKEKDSILPIALYNKVQGPVTFVKTRKERKILQQSSVIAVELKKQTRFSVTISSESKHEYLLSPLGDFNVKLREELRWRRNRTGRPLSSLQIHRKNIWTNFNKFAEQISQNNFWSLAEDIRHPEKQPIVCERR